MTREREFKPTEGRNIRIGELERMGRAVARISSVDGPGIVQGGHGVAFVRPQPDWFWIKISAKDSSTPRKYTWEMVVPDGEGDFQQAPGGPFGSPSTLPAYEINGKDCDVTSPFYAQAYYSTFDVWFVAPEATSVPTFSLDATFEGDLTVEGDTTLEGDLTVEGDTVLQKATHSGPTIYADSGTDLTISANVNDLTLPAFPVQFFNVTSDANLTGIVAGVDGQRILRCNKGNATLTIVNEDSGSTAANRIRTPYSTYADVLLPPNFWVEFQYDASISRWRVLWVSATHLYGTDELESFGSTETDYQMDQRWPFKVITTASGGSTLETIAYGKRGQWYWLQVAAGSDPLTITHQKSGGTAGNLICCPGAIDYVLPQCSGVAVFYDGTYWQVLANQNRPLVILFVDVDLTIPAPAVPEIKVIINIPLTTDRVITLPPASQSKAGTRVEIIDKGGTLGSPYSVTIERAGSDTINGVNSKQMYTPYSRLSFVSDGVSKWTYNPFSAGGAVGLGNTYIGVGDGSGYLSGSANFTNGSGLTGNVTENSTGQTGYKVTHRSDDTTMTNSPGFKVVRSGGTIASPTDTTSGMYVNGLIGALRSSGIETERARVDLVAASATACDIELKAYYGGAWNTSLKVDGSNGSINLPQLTASRILSLDSSKNVVSTIDASTLLTTSAAAAAYQPLDSDLTTLGGGGSGARTFLGLGTSDSPEFTAVNVGHANDTTLARSSAGNLTVEGNLLYRAGGTDVPIADGGTGQSTAYAGLDALTVAGSDIASASTTDIAAGTGLYITITGTTTITALGTAAAGVVRILKFSGALTLTHNATSLILPGAINITTSSGDVAVMASLGSGNWRCVSFTHADGPPWRGYTRMYAGSFTHDISTATGNQPYTGPGFKPKALICINCTGGASNAQASWAGTDDGTTAQCIENVTSGYTRQPSMSMICRTAVSGANFSRGAVASFDDTGFTVLWTKVGTPTGTATVSYIAVQ